MLDERRYRRVLCYPHSEARELRTRLSELKQLGITALVFEGHVRVNGVAVLGKGHVGIVVRAYRNDEPVAIKIRRVDADRLTMQHEAEMLQKANVIGVGPCLLGYTGDFLLMEYVTGTLLPRWLDRLGGKGEKERLHHVLRSILEQAWRLDKAGLDHGELSNAPRHVIIRRNDEPCLVDFETASAWRRVANVTSLCQYLLLRSPAATTIREKLGEVSEDCLVDALREYKPKRTEESFRRILAASGIQQACS